MSAASLEERCRALSEECHALLEAGDAAGAERAFHAALETATSEAELRTILDTEPYELATWTYDDGHTEATVRVVLARALSFASPAERAAGVGLSAMLAVPTLRGLVSSEMPAVRDGARRGLEASVDVLRTLATSRSAALRAAGAMALARIRVDDADVERWITSLARERGEAAAGIVLALGIVGRRPEHGALFARVTAAVRKHEKSRGLAGAFATIAGVLLRGRAEARDEKPLRAALAKPIALPASLGTVDASGRRETTRDLVNALLHVVPPEPALVRALLGELETPDDAELVASIAFGELRKREGRGRALEIVGLPRRGLVREDLSPFQRDALLAIARLEPDFALRQPLGFANDMPREVAPFLAGQLAAWRPLEVTRRNGARRHWHLAAIVRSAVLDEDPTLAEAARALTAGLPAEELVATMLDRRQRIVLLNERPSLAEWARDRALHTAVLDALALRGHDVKTIVADRLARWELDGPDHGSLLGALAQHVGLWESVPEILQKSTRWTYEGVRT